MGIHAGGCIYVGKDGKRRQIDLSAAASSPDGFRSLMDSLSQYGTSRPRRNAPVVPPLPMSGSTAQNEKSRERQPMPGSAIVDTRNGLALRGEEDNPLVEGKKVYGSVDGRKGYHTLDELDPVAQGGIRIGAAAHQESDVAAESPNTDQIHGFDGRPYRYSFVSRLAVTGADEGIVNVFAFEREESLSPGRRVGGISPETQIPLFSFPIPSEGKRPDRMPFDIEKSDDGQRKIVRAVFYYGGKERTVEDTNITPTGSVWLLMEESEDEGSEDAEPTFSITQNEPGEDAKAIRLYDFDDEGNVSVDYRTAFVAFGDKPEEGGVTSLNEMDGDIEIVAGDGSVEVDEKPIRVVVEKKEGEGGKKIVISLSDEEDEEEEEEKEKEEHCNHPGTEEAGGVPAEGGGFGPGIGIDGGVPAEGGTVHPGVSCNCD